MAKIVNGWNIPQTGDKFTSDWGSFRESLDTKFAQLVNSDTGKYIFSADSDYVDFVTIYNAEGNSAIVFDTVNNTIIVDSLTPNTLVVSDNDKKLRKLFGVAKDYLGLIDGRTTYVVDKKGIVKLVFDSTSAKIHIAKTLEILKKEL